MNETVSKARNIILLVIFVMLVICSLLSVSYAYYTKRPDGDSWFITSNVTVDCLSISYYDSISQQLSGSSPAYLYPTSNATAVNLVGVSGFTYAGITGKAFGQAYFRIKNQCNAATNFDIVFIPNSSNQISMNYINYSHCADTGPNCADGGTQTNIGTLGNSSTCFAPTASQLWLNLAKRYSPTAGSPYYNLGSDNRICSMVRARSSTGLSIAANGTYTITVRYWLNDTVSLSTVNGKRLSGSIVVYTMS